MSYSNDALIPQDRLVDLFKQHGEIFINTQSLKRYNSMPKNDFRYNLKTHIEEHLYYLKPYADQNRLSKFQ